MKSRLVLYLVIPLVIASWWFLAFNSASHPPHQLSIKNQEPFALITSAPISLIKREAIHKALQGDFELMAALIAEWDVEARLLQSYGITGVKRLPQHSFVQSQLLVRYPDLALSFPYDVCDDLGCQFKSSPNLKLLPQTYLAASLLLTITSPNKIAALPEGMRNQGHLYPSEIMAKVPQDLNRYHSEKLYSDKPDIAFVAHYSHPAALHMLKQQGISLFTIKNVEKVEDIHHALMHIGFVIGNLREAQLLHLFMDAAFMAIDNQFLALNTDKSNLRVLYLNHYSQFSVPSSSTLVGQLLERLGVEAVRPGKTNTNSWNLPISQEQIIALNPEAIIVSTTNPEALRNQILNNSAFAHLSAVTSGHLYFVDEIVQECPSQYLTLAYYDLFSVLAPQIAEKNRSF